MARSPNYPGVDLKFAVERAQRLWDRQQAHTGAVEVVMQNLGYSSRSGPASTTYGALKRFGLLEEPERGRAGLTPLGIAVIRGETTGQRDYERLRQAALHPKLHQDIWERYGTQLPADSVVTFDLREVGFTESGAADFVAQWKRTMQFAKLADATDTIPQDGSGESSDEDESNDATEPVTSAATEPAPVREFSVNDGSMVRMSNMRAVQLPYSRTGWAVLQAEFPMTEAEWHQMLAVMEAMKPVLVAPDE